MHRPETVSFEDPATRQHQEQQLQQRILQEHSASIIERNGSRTPRPAADPSEQVAFPSFTFARGPDISLPKEDTSGTPTGNTRPQLTTIHSGSSTPIRAQTPPPGAAASSENGSGTGANAKGPLSWSTSSMPESGRKQRGPPMQRAGSILEDLKAKGTGIPTAMGPTTPGTAELELGTNPFENSSLLTATTTPAPVTPSLQSSIAYARRPTTARMAGEVGAPQASLNQALKERLSRLTAANNARAAEGGVGTPERSGRTPGALPPGRGVSENAELPSDQTGSYFSSTAGAPSATVQAGASSSSHRRRSSSNARHGSISSIDKPGLNRAFTRSRKPTDARRRSSSSVDGQHAFSPRSPSGEPPSFTFSHNPHGNGGLQNAVRAISDAHLRTASEPTRSTIDAGTTSYTRQMPAPYSKSVMDEHIWIGTPGCSIADFDDPLRDSMEKRYMQEKHSAVVWVEDDVLEPAYDMFCKQILWPTFHYQVLDAHKSKAYESPSWLDYKAMNQAIADKIISIYKPGDLSEFPLVFQGGQYAC